MVAVDELWWLVMVGDVLNVDNSCVVGDVLKAESLAQSQPGMNPQLLTFPCQ